MSNEPKVTECWAIETDDGSPTTDFIFAKKDAQQRDAAAILLWRDDYAALIKEREELRKRCRYDLDPGAQITCWDEYESLRARYDDIKEELKEYIAEFKKLIPVSADRARWQTKAELLAEENEQLRKELEQRDAELEKLREKVSELCTNRGWQE